MGELGNTACLSATADVMNNFFAGRAQAGEVDAGWQCIENAFKTFNRYFTGKRDPEKIFPDELATFFEKYFIELDPVTKKPKNRISPEFQHEFMKIKQLFLGGSREYLSREEFNRIADIISRLRELSKKVNRYMGVYTLNWRATGDDYNDIEFFEAANTTLQDFSKEISSLMVPDHQPYSFDDFFSLLDEWAKFYNDNWDFVATIKQYMPLVSKIKKVVAGGPEDRIHYEEWENFLLLGARAYIQYTRYVYFLSESPTGTSIRLSHISSAVSDLMSAFEDLLREKPDMDTRRPGHRVREDEGRISREDLDELLGALHQVWPRFVFSKILVDEMMSIKQVVFGGSEKYWNAQDFEKAKLKVPHIKDILEKILPYYSIYINEWNPDRYTNEKAQIHFKQAQINLSDALSQLGGLLEASYSLKQISRLLAEIEKLYPGTVQGLRLDDAYNKYLPLIQQVKNLLFEDNDDVIHKFFGQDKVVNQWPDFLSMAGQMYTFYLHFNYFISERPWDDYRVLFSLRYLLDSSFGTLQDFLDTKPSHVVTSKETGDLVRKLQDLEIISKDLRDITIERTVHAVLNSLVNPYDRRIDGVKPSLIDKPVLDNVKYETATWLETEIFIRDIFGKPSDNLTITPFDLQKKIDEKLLEIQGSSSPLKTGLLGIKKVLSSSIPMIIDQDSRLQISANMNFLYSGSSVSRLNLTRAASRLLVRAYAGDKSRAENVVSVTDQEAEFAYKELRWPFIDMGILEPGDDDFISSRFLEANIFVPRADGNKEASFLELNDIVNTIFSGVKLNSQLAPGLYDGVVVNGAVVAKCLPGAVDPPSSATVDFTCLMTNYRHQVPVIFTSMPDYLRFLKTNDACQTEVLFYNLLKAAGYVPNDEKKVMLADSGLLPHIVQYLELVMVRFDADKGGTLTLEEAEKAWPVFHDIFADLAKDYSLPEDALFPLFTWVLKKGRIPDGLGDILDFGWWWKVTKPKNRKISTDRNKLGAILGVVADKVAATKRGPLTEDQKNELSIRNRELLYKHLSPRCEQKVREENEPKQPDPWSTYPN